MSDEQKQNTVNEVVYPDSMPTGATRLPRTLARFRGKWVVIRTLNAGVHVGVFEDFENGMTVLSRGRRIWGWAGAFSLHEVAHVGIGTGSQVSIEVPEIVVLETTEIILAAEKAVQSIASFEVHL